MTASRPPGGDSHGITLPCGTTVATTRLDLGMREYTCECGADHAVVMDVHPPTRFLPGFLIDTLQTAIETTDAFDEFGTPHLLGLVMEEFPDDIVVADRSADGRVGFGLVWIAAFDSRRLHEVIVELVVELMEHAMSHANDDEALTRFEEDLAGFSIDEFVTEYRKTREFSPEDVPGYGRTD